MPLGFCASSDESSVYPDCKGILFFFIVGLKSWTKQKTTKPKNPQKNKQTKPQKTKKKQQKKLKPTEQQQQQQNTTKVVFNI